MALLKSNLVVGLRVTYSPKAGEVWTGTVSQVGKKVVIVSWNEGDAFDTFTMKEALANLSIAPDRSLEDIKAVILANGQDPTKGTYAGLRSSEIAAYNRRLMFGENDEAFPSQEEWSKIVD